MKLSDRVNIPPHVLARKIGEETAILNLESGVYFGLDSIGVRMWGLLAEGSKLARICDTMQVEFEVERDILEEDVKRLVQDIKDQGLIIPVENL